MEFVRGSDLSEEDRICLCGGEKVRKRECDESEGKRHVCAHASLICLFFFVLKIDFSFFFASAKGQR
jgi:hypothetical protein